MNNNISFQGLNNLSIAKKNFVTHGSYITKGGRIKYGDKDNLYVRIKCDLTNDASGNHLDKFKEALSQCDAFYKENCVSKDNPNAIELLMRNYQVEGDKDAEFNCFKINGCEIPMNNRAILPLYSFMAYLTREASKHPTTTSTRQKYTDIVNTKVADTAMDYIENRM